MTRSSTHVLLTTCALIAITSNEPAHAGKKELQALLQSPTRPTITEVAEAMKPPPDGTSFFSNLLSIDQKYVESLARRALKTEVTKFRVKSLQTVADGIARLEKLFPNATWAPLGRDAVIWGDIMDAFYTSLGQPGRVVRLNASTQTLMKNRYENISREETLRFLRSAGFELDHVSEQKPFVMLDRTGFYSVSQSMTLMNAIYSTYAQNGGDPQNLIRKVNFVGLDNFQFAPKPDTDHYFSQVKINPDTHTVDQILQLPAGPWTDSTPWHAPFGSLAVQPNGNYEGTAQEPQSTKNRRELLGEMILLIREASSPEFLLRVKTAASELGYEFPVASADPCEGGFQ